MGASGQGGGYGGRRDEDRDEHSGAQRAPAGAGRRLRVWDLPTRLFHWSLALGMICAFISAQSGGYTAQRLHYLCGYAVLVLVGFRVCWGYAGPRYARFAQFVRGPLTTLRYVRGLAQGLPASSAPGYPGHNPLGALSVLALLAASGLQALTGLFANDDIASEGPLAHFVSDHWVGRMTVAHQWGEIGLLALFGLHLGAIAFYRYVKGERLLGPMLTGDKVMAGGTLPAAQEQAAGHGGGGAAGADGADNEPGPLWPRALVLLALNAALVVYLVNMG